MTAFRWIFFSLVAFAAGTGIAFAMHPPSVGLPTAAATGFATDLRRIEELADNGQCEAIEGKFKAFRARINGLPSSTPDAYGDQLGDALTAVKTSARARCREVDAERKAAEEERRLEEERKAAEEAAQETTPTTPDETLEPSTPDPGSEDGGPDPGTGEGDDGGLPTNPDGTEPTDPGPGSGGVAPGIGDAQGEFQRRLQKEADKWEDRLRKVQERWGQ